MKSTELTLVQPESLPQDLDFAASHFSAETYKTSGNFTSAIPTDIGAIPVPDEIVRSTPIDVDKEVMIEPSSIKFRNGTMNINAKQAGEEWSERDIDLVRAFEPALLMIDADFRQRAALVPEVVLQPDVTVVVGVYDEWQQRSNAVPHLDGYGDASMVYFAALGAGTQIYPGDFYVDPSHTSTKEPEDEIAAQIEEKAITPIELTSGRVYAANWSTVHASPAAEHIGEERRFLRVTYKDYSIVPPAEDVATSTLEPAPASRHADIW